MVSVVVPKEDYLVVEGEAAGAVFRGILVAQSLSKVLRREQPDRQFGDVERARDDECVFLAEVVKDVPLDGASKAGDESVLDSLYLDAHSAWR